jgi:hypothetical protein
MSIAFNKTKSQTLELSTFLDFGKYKDCRVDSIIEQDHDYIQYLKFNKIRPLAPSVLEALENKFSATSIEVEKNRIQGARHLKKYGISALFGSYTEELGPEYDDWEDDIPF